RSHMHDVTPYNNPNEGRMLSALVETGKKKNKIGERHHVILTLKTCSCGNGLVMVSLARTLLR
ncbi:hypothetical protein PSY31_24020, partial [Shigella flexneri]|nr:hypothetical protein [Shigella flexneri]